MTKEAAAQNATNKKDMSSAATQQTTNRVNNRETPGKKLLPVNKTPSGYEQAHLNIQFPPPAIQKVYQRAVIQCKRVHVFLKGIKNVDIHIETDEEGNISGEALLNTIAAQLNELIFKGTKPGIRRVLSAMLAGKKVNEENNYKISAAQDIHYFITTQVLDTEERDSKGIDEGLVSLAKESKRCIIGCFLQGKPGDETELIKQQALENILAALYRDESCTITLIDPNFSKLAHEGQVIDHLIKKYGIKFNIVAEGKKTIHTITEFKGKKVTATIRIIYFGDFVNKPTQDAIRENGGEWYSDK